MALDRISTSGLQANLRAFETTAHNVSQLNVEEPQLYRTRFESNPPPPRGGGGVRAQTERVTPNASQDGGSPVLSPEVGESFVRDQVDLVQEFTDAIVAQRGFQANLAAQRTARSFMEATLNLRG
jgi:hypothetical protein